jgi:hypothetical protein
MLQEERWTFVQKWKAAKYGGRSASPCLPSDDERPAEPAGADSDSD